jgi:hypothetical protein
MVPAQTGCVAGEHVALDSSPPATTPAFSTRGLAAVLDRAPWWDGREVPLRQAWANPEKAFGKIRFAETLRIGRECLGMTGETSSTSAGADPSEPCRRTDCGINPPRSCLTENSGPVTTGNKAAIAANPIPKAPGRTGSRRAFCWEPATPRATGNFPRSANDSCHQPQR